MKPVHVLPAHAGMILRAVFVDDLWHRAPRSRGDDPHGLVDSERHRPVLPAHAGMIPAVWNQPLSVSSAPRSRGDDPSSNDKSTYDVECSPLTRG